MNENEKNLSQSLNDDDTIDLRQLFSILSRNKFIIFLCVLIFAIVSYFYTKSKSPVYEANALIQVEEKGNNLGLNEFSEMFEAESGVATEIEIIKSRFVLGKVVDDQSLRIHANPTYLPFIKLAPEFNDYLINDYAKNEDNFFSSLGIDLNRFNTTDASMQVEQLRLPQELISKTLTIKITSHNSYDLLDSEGTYLFSGSLGLISFSNDGKIMLLVRAANTHPGAEFSLLFTRRINEINTLRSQLKIKEQGKNTGILSIALEGIEHSQIKETLNSIVQVYQNQNIARQSEEAQRSIAFLEQQIPKIQKDLEIAERQANEYRAKSSSTDLDIETRTTLQKIVVIEEKLNELKLKESELSTRYKKGHPVYATLLKQQRRLIQEKERINQQIEKLPAKQQELLGLMRDVEVTSAVYLQLLNKREALKVVRAGTVGNVRILDEAEALAEPIRPKQQRIMAIAIFLGGFIGVGIAFMRSWLNQGLSNPAEIQDKLNLANYGVIPVSRSQRKVDKGIVAASKKQPDILATVDPTDPALEAIRSIRTSLHFAMLEAKNNIVILTSPSPGAGKSFVSSNLATLIAQSGQKVLLVDMDMRRGHIHKALHVEREPGLSDLLSKGNATSEGIELTDIVHAKIQPNFDFIATGSIPPNPSELIMSSACSRFLDQIQQAYDIVIIDTPPVLAVTDPSLIGRQIGACLLVLRHSVNSMQEVKQAQEELNRLNVPLKGYIYNFAEFESGSNYSYNYYYYNYSNPSQESASWDFRRNILNPVLKRIKKFLSA